MGRVVLARGCRARAGLGVESKPFRPSEQSDMDYSLARDSFVRGNYRDAYQWAQRADRIMPQARVHAIMAQTLFAQGAYRGAATEARAAASKGPLRCNCRPNNLLQMTFSTGC